MGYIKYTKYIIITIAGIVTNVKVFDQTQKFISLK